MVMLIVGILAAIALPRFTSKTEFDGRGFLDQTQSMIRYAQTLAIAQRRSVWVQVSQTPHVICLTYAAASTNCSNDGGAPVLAPEDQTWFVRTAPSDITFGSTLQFSFNALGQPINALGQPSPAIALTLFQNGSSSVGQIQVEAETGYVH